MTSPTGHVRIGDTVRARNQCGVFIVPFDLSESGGGGWYCAGVGDDGRGGSLT